MKRTFHLFSLAMILAVMVILVGITPIPVQAAGTARLFGTVGNAGTGLTSTLVELNPLTGGLISTIGNVGYLVTGLDYDPVSGNLYATTSTNDPTFPDGLLTINMTTGAGTPIGSGFGLGTVNNVRANAAGTLFGMFSPPFANGAFPNGALATINPVTGTASVVGDSGLVFGGFGMSFDTTGTLYLVNGIDESGRIYTINTSTGASTYTGIVVGTGQIAHHGDFNPDTNKYWGINIPGAGAKSLWVVNIDTGAIEQTLSTVNNLHTLAFVPASPPSTQEIRVFTRTTERTDGISVSFGDAVVGSPITKTFTIKNDGMMELTLTEPVSLPAGFSLESSFGTLTLTPGAITTFKVRLDAAEAGNYSGEVSFANNDADENPFNLMVDGSVHVLNRMGDFNGDGKAEIAVFRPSTSTWHIYGIGDFVYGTVGDIPVPADYNGDGKDDIAVFRPSTSTWHIYGVGDFVYGTVGDIPVIADYNGDKKADIAVFRPSTSTWHIYGVGDFVYGTVGDIPVIADYNGDGKADIAVFRPSTSTWHIYGMGDFVYGTVGDIPVVADYNGDKKADIAVFRPSTSTWHIYGVGDFIYGTVGDIPV